MRINEIILNPSQNDYPASYEYHFRNVIDQHPLPLTPDYEFRAAMDNSEFHMGIWHKDTIVSYTGMHQESFGWQVDKITTDMAYRSKGFIRYSIEYAAKKYGKIYSDYHQTSEAAATWKALIKYRNTNLYYLFDTLTKDMTLINYDHNSNCYVPDPWDDTDQYIICAVHDPKRHAINEQRLKFNLLKNRNHPMIGDHFTELNP